MHTQTFSDHRQKKAGFRLWYFFFFVRKVIWLAYFIIRSRKKEMARAYKLLEKTEHDFNGRFNINTRKKIAISYGIYNPMMMDAFAQLHGRYTGKEEKKRLIYYFICSSLFDDFTDYHLISREQLAAISFDPENYGAITFDEKVFQHAHLLLKKIVKDKSSYEHTSKELFQAQMDSQKQYKSSLTDKELMDITFKKGGNAVLLCRYYLDTEDNEMENACWYRIGSLIQLTNDLFDIWKDGQDDISTLATRIKNAKDFEQFFIDQINSIKNIIRSFNCSQKEKEIFSLRMAGIYSFGLIAINQLKKIQDKQEQLPALSALSRKDLIIDMEKISNILLWFRFTYYYAQL